ncbi:wall-associated receptor kinase-like 1 [Vicia villosa]|uniref:wall-associated receptor kinase-like 1 n=1 Tax=Vicia villosa TaxID=3911 RepID=UPI00273C44C8|nr:wall-associated receptor kinase-like 1 [Vicia villosa]
MASACRIRNNARNLLKLVGEYGPRCKRELWRVQYALSRICNNERNLLTLDEKNPRWICNNERNLLTLDEKNPHWIFEDEALLMRIFQYGLLDETQNKLDYVLALTIQNFLERRLQILVFKSGMAKSIHHARVLIWQRHIGLLSSLNHLFCFSVTIISGPVLIMVLEKDNAIANWHALMGHTNASKAKITHPHSTSSKTVTLTDSPFLYSQAENTFLAVGCNSLAFLQSNGTTVGGCVSICDDNKNNSNNFNIDSNGCNGRYCCTTSLPSHLSEFNATIRGLSEHSSQGCGYALIARSYFMGDYETEKELKNKEYAPAMLEWEILNYMLTNSTFQLPPNCYDSNVTSLSNRNTGKQCRCSSWQQDDDFDSPFLDGDYYGNPYIAGGCKGPEYYFHKNNQWKKWVIVGISSSLGSLGFLIGLLFLYKVLKRRMIKKRKEKFFKRNGGLLLQKRMSSGEVNVDRTTLFTLKNLKKATDNFNKDRVLGKGGQGTVYKGMLVDGKIVAVKKFKVEGNVEEFINEFVILSQINNRNIVKLLGCCLETEIPLLVYEFIPNGNLFEYLHDQNEDIPMTWDVRLRIASEVAGALFYLHSVASQPIYHRDVKSTNILLDEKYRAKLADFGASRIISIEATHLTTMVQGTFGYLDPEYFHTSQFTEKSDVYSFGVVLAELLTGKKPISSTEKSKESQSLASYFVQCMKENMLFDVIDKRITEGGEKEHIIVVANLAFRCLEMSGRKRPTMKEVTLELEGIMGLNKKLNAQQNHEEIEQYQHYDGFSTSNSLPIDSSQTHSTDSEVKHILALE